MLRWAGRDATLQAVEDRISRLLKSEAFMRDVLPAIRMLRGGHIDYTKGGLTDAFLFALIISVVVQGHVLEGATPTLCFGDAPSTSL
jgi:hypothetical protein